MNRPTHLRFSPGEIIATRGALEHLAAHGVPPARLLARHMSGADWGELDADDVRANEAALVSGARLLSCYVVGEVKLYVITEAEPREVTTILLADEY